MLTYAFDLLYAIYEEQGYQATDIPRLILENNLYGIEIDQRAGALAAFALTMKAREKDKRFFTRTPLTPNPSPLTPNVCVLENIHIDPEDLSAYMDKVGRDLFSGGLQGVVNQWEEADNFGSLIRPLVTDVSEVLELLRERQLGEDLFLSPVHQKVLKALKQADYLSPKYHVVVANPPYMGNKGMTPSLREFVTKHFEIGKSDLFGAFMCRGSHLIYPDGYVGFVTPYVWMYLVSFEKLRKDLLKGSTILSLIQLEYNAFEPACIPVCTFVLSKQRSTTPGTYIGLAEFRGADNQAPRTLAAINDSDCDYRYSMPQTAFEKIPGSPIAYAMPTEQVDLFEKENLDCLGHSCSGIQTGDNEKYLRYWFEVSLRNTAFGFNSFEEVANAKKRWIPHKKGGAFRKWFGNDEYVIDWLNGGESIKSNPSARPQNIDKMFEVGATWSHTSSSGFGARYKQRDVTFNVEAPCILTDDAIWMTALLNSSVSKSLIELIAPTLHFLVGAIKLLPSPSRSTNKEQVIESASEIVELSKNDWNARETAWEFRQNSILGFVGGKSVSAAFESYYSTAQETTDTVVRLEGQINTAFRSDYGLASDETDIPRRSEVSLWTNPLFRYDEDKSKAELEALLLADTMREFVSYAVGCMFGRYSLDKPGLILANAGDTTNDYRQQIPEPTFPPDEDNVIPLLDGDWFTDDISERFKEFLKITFGTKHYEENLTFLEDSLYPKNLTGSKRKDIRDYFLKDFYNHHIKLYKKRPIYWLFSSPKGTFNALIYMHRYRPDTVSVILNDYLREFQTKLTAKLDHLQSVADSGEASKIEKTKALKEITTLKKQLKELVDYERDILYPLASEQIEIDLDDGVKVNYNKFGKALKKVTGLTGKA